MLPVRLAASTLPATRRGGPWLISFYRRPLAVEGPAVAGAPTRTITTRGMGLRRWLGSWSCGPPQDCRRWGSHGDCGSLRCSIETALHLDDLSALSSAGPNIKATSIAAKTRHTRLTARISKRLGFIGVLEGGRSEPPGHRLPDPSQSPGEGTEGPPPTVGVSFRAMVIACQVPL
jgi:hypothetical protein